MYYYFGAESSGGQTTTITVLGTLTGDMSMFSLQNTLQNIARDNRIYERYGVRVLDYNIEQINNDQALVRVTFDTSDSELANVAVNEVVEIRNRLLHEFHSSQGVGPETFEIIDE